MVQAGVRNGSYAEASRELRESAELEIGPQAIERAVKRIGGERLAERAAGVETWQALPLPDPCIAAGFKRCGRATCRRCLPNFESGRLNLACRRTLRPPPIRDRS